MSLDGAILICLDADNQGDIIPAHGKTFKFGYYMDCDVILEHPEALGLQCTIDCDAFGRVTIENRCSEQPITLNGNILRKMRPLLHNTEICIFNKKYSWHFEASPETGFQMEDCTEFTTPYKQIKKAEQPPNSEPSRKWRSQFPKRLTIHSFAYCIKAGESPEDVELTSDENKPLNTYERIISAEGEPTSTKNISSSSAVTADLIDLKTPKVKQRSTAAPKTPLSCCNLSGTVITSYSSHEPSLHATVATPTKLAANPNVTLSIFQHMPSPLTQNPRVSMHLIDLTTPMKNRLPTSPARTLLKSALQKNIPKTKKIRQKQAGVSKQDTSAASVESVYSIHSTDDESVIELSDEGSFSPSPVLKTPPRPRTPQSLMKRAILSSAKKAGITKRLQQSAAQVVLPPSALTPKKPIASSRVRIQCHSTPQRKSLGRLQSSDGGSVKTSHSVSGKTAKAMITSTPFRAPRESTVTSSRGSSISRSPSTSLTGVKNKTRTSLMLKQALSKSPQKSATEKRKSVSFLEVNLPNNQTQARKSVSFLDRIASEQAEDNQTLNQTFTIDADQDDFKELERCHDKDPSRPKNDNVTAEVQQELSIVPVSPSNVTFSPIKTESTFATETAGLPVVNLSLKGSEGNADVLVERSTTHTPLNETFSPEKIVVAQDVEGETKANSTLKAQLLNADIQQSTENDVMSICLKENITPTVSTIELDSTNNLKTHDDAIENDDFDGLDAIFKTPRAKNLMILSSPKSISLQKPPMDSVELLHSTEFDLSANLEDIFRTPQSEFITNRVEVDATPVVLEKTVEAFTPEDAFDMLVGRPINRRSYIRKSPPKKSELLPLIVPKDPTFPKTDIEEWIGNVNKSIELLDTDQVEDEMSYLTATQSEYSQDPLMSSIAESANTSARQKGWLRLPAEKSSMTIEEYDEEENMGNTSELKDPLEITQPSPKKSLSPNISGIDLLDHTSESIFSETLAVSDESSEKENEKTIAFVEADKADSLACVARDFDVSSVKARKEMEQAFEHFEHESRIVEQKMFVSTPEAKNPTSIQIIRQTIGNQQTLDAFFNLKTQKIESEMELAFEKFEENPIRSVEERSPETVEIVKPERKNVQQTVGNEMELDSIFDVNAAKTKRKMELAFENFEENPGFSEEWTIRTPQAKNKMTPKDHRRTTGTEFIPEEKFNVEEAKAEREMELAFENFEEKPTISEEKVAQTSEPKKSSLKDHRRTMGSSLVTEVKLDLQAAKAEREMVAFENFEEEPTISKERVAQTPEPKKVSLKDDMRTMGTKYIPEDKSDVEETKAEREMELAFENFEEEPTISKERVAQTPEPKKASLKDHRRTMGSSMVTEVKLDLQAAKADREMELAFENFEEEPTISQQRGAQTPEPKKSSLKDHRRTMGSSLVTEVKLDLQAAKAEREMELAFENFEEEPTISQQRVAQTPEPKKASLKDHRRTMGSSMVTEVKLDLQAAKADREMELAFENFEEEPTISQQRGAQTPEPKKSSLKDHRRTMGSSLVTEVKLDLQAAKSEREMELAFENFEEEPTISQQRVAQTPEPRKASLKDHRRTMGTKFIPEEKFDVEEAKAEREMELAFENFEEEPTISKERVVQTPEPKKSSLKDHRRTMGSSLVTEVKLDLQSAKAEREMELAFENFEEEPTILQQRGAQTPEPKKSSLKDHRRTMGSSLVTEVKLDLQAAKAEREMELAFENFEEEPTISKERVVQTPEPKKSSLKDHRRTMGSSLVTEVKLDLQSAKAEREMELAFENFEEEPTILQQRGAQTPEPKKSSLKNHRRTMGSSLVTEVKLDLQAAKAEREMELAFENFEEEPTISKERVAQTPEPKKASLKDHRRTMGSSLVTEVKLDLQAAKAEREMELAFENFEEEPTISDQRVAQTPELKKSSLKDHRRTMGSSLVTEVNLDLQAAKAEREMELAFENFEEEPTISKERVAQTPEPKKASLKDHRRTMGSSLVTEVKLDLQAAKAGREMELAFENFEEEPNISEQRVAQTPEPKKSSLKDHRRSMGTNFMLEEKFDVQEAKAEREMELAFENFEEEPTVSKERIAQTPEPKKVSLRDHRMTKCVPDVQLDVELAKAERKNQIICEKDGRFTSNQVAAVESEQLTESGIQVVENVVASRYGKEDTINPGVNSLAKASTEIINLRQDTIDEAKELQTETAEEEDHLMDAYEKQLITEKVEEVREHQEKNSISMNERKITRSRRKRQNTIDDVEQLNEIKRDAEMGSTTTTADLKTETNQMRKRTRRQNSVDVCSNIEEIQEDRSSGDAKKLAIEGKEEMDQTADDKDPKHPIQSKDVTEGAGERSLNPIQTSPNPSLKCHENSNTDIDTHAAQPLSTDLDSTEDETKPVKTTRKKRLRKIPTVVALSAQTVKVVHHHLEPIVEEEKKLGTPSTSQEVLASAEAKPLVKQVHHRAGRKEVTMPDDVRPTDDPKSMLSLKEEDEIISSSPISSNNRIRVRRAQLNVVLVKPTSGVKQNVEEKEKAAMSVGECDETMRTLPIKSASEEEHTGNESKNVEIIASKAESTTELQAEKTDSEDVIESTPIPIKRRGRKPAIELECTNSTAPVLRRGRRGSVQEDPEVKSGDKGINDVEEETPSKPRGRKPAIKVESAESTASALRRGRRGSVQEDPKVRSGDLEVEIPSTPVPSKSRGRKPAIKVESIESTIPTLRRGRRGSVQEDPEVKSGDKGINDVEEGIPSTPVPSISRGRKPAIKVESIDSTVPTLRRGRRGSVQQDCDVKAEEVKGSTPVLSKSRSRKAAVVKLEAAESNPAILTPEQKIGRNVGNTEETDIDEAVPSTPVPPKPRGRKAAVKLNPTDAAIESSTPVQRRGRRRAVEEVTEVNSVSHDVVEAVPSIETLESKSDVVAELQMEGVPPEDDTHTSTVIPLKTRGRKHVPKIESDGERSTLIRKGLRRDTVDQDGDVHIEETAVAPTKSSGQILETKLPAAAKTSTPDLKRGRKRTVEALEIHTDEGENAKVIPSKKRGRQAAVKALEAVEQNTKVQVEVPVVDAGEVVRSMKRGRPAAVKLEPTEVIEDNSIPTQKRGRRGVQEEEVTASAKLVPKDIHLEVSDIEEALMPSVPVPTRSRGRQAKLKEGTVEGLTPVKKRGKRGEKKSEEESTDSSPVKFVLENKPIRSRRASAKPKEEQPIQLAEVTIEEKSENKSSRSRSRKAVLLTSSSQPASEGDETQEEQPPKKSARGRPPSKKNLVEETTSTEEDQLLASATKTARGRKAVVSTSSEKENIQVKEGNKTAAVRGWKGNNKVEAVEAKVPADPEVEKSTRGRRGGAVQITPDAVTENESKVVEEIKKPMRGRKATVNVVQEPNDEQSQTEEEAPKKSTRSRKSPEPSKKEEKAAIPKRAIRRNVADVIAEDDQDNTPSKRIRRKPNILLSDEFVH